MIRAIGNQTEILRCAQNDMRAWVSGIPLVMLRRIQACAMLLSLSFLSVGGFLPVFTGGTGSCCASRCCCAHNCPMAAGQRVAAHSCAAHSTTATAATAAVAARHQGSRAAVRTPPLPSPGETRCSCGVSQDHPPFSSVKIDLRFSLVAAATLNPPAILSFRPMDAQPPTLEATLRPPDHPPRLTSY